ncbi:MAG: class II fructose-bisphosphate aldolase [Pseudomonadota bacterium]
MELWENVDSMKNACKGAFEIKGDALAIADENRFRHECMDKLVWNAVFNADALVRDVARWVVWEGALALGCPSASIHDLYAARVGDAWKDMTVPAINIRGMTYDTARVIFKTLTRHNATACLFEIAKSEMAYTAQNPSEYVTCVLGAALRENWRSPVFIQGDHFQANAKKYVENPKAEMGSLKNLIADAIAAGFYNIDIDSSTLVDLSKPTTLEQQRANFEVAAELTKHIRELSPKGVTVSVGGEIGEVGTANSTPEELSAFVEGYKTSMGAKLSGISKISIQTGTSHGGVVLPDGSVAKVAIDFGVIDKLGEMCRREFKIGGVVQHGASTLPESAFDNFPKHQAMEVHLATGFQNTLFDSTSFPKNLKEQIYKWLDSNCASEKKPGMTPEQFYYKARKKGYGTFKRELWSLTDNTKSALMSELARQFDMLFTKLNIKGSRDVVEKFVKPAAVHHPFPKEGAPKVAMKIEHDDNPNAD